MEELQYQARVEEVVQLQGRVAEEVVLLQTFQA